MTNKTSHKPLHFNQLQSFHSRNIATCTDAVFLIQNQKSGNKNYPPLPKKQDIRNFLWKMTTEFGLILWFEPIMHRGSVACATLGSMNTA
jgi:hypothetical protein